jgi:methylphosphotriester-DNA--protein-cysteine methyltransferase
MTIMTRQVAAGPDDGDGDARFERAWRARDPAFDGRFVVCVRTTGIYCRCTCPARQALSRNVSFLPDGAAAERAGYRACKRCRPTRSGGARERGSSDCQRTSLC